MSFTTNSTVEELINQIDTGEIQSSELLKNLEFNNPVTADIKIVPLKWILENYAKLYADPYSLQRFLTPWDDDKRNSYLSTLISGLNHKDSFQLAAIKPIIDDYKRKINSGECSKSEIEAFNYAITEFESLLDKGYEYLILDGQHRLKEIFDYLTGETTSFFVIDGFDHEATIKYIDDKGNPQFSVFQLGGKFTDLPPIAQAHFLYNITVPVTYFTTGSLKILAFIFYASNNGDPLTWHENRSVLHNNNYITWLKERILKSRLRYEFWNYVKLSSPLEKKGDTLFLSHITPWYLLQQDDNHGIPMHYNFGTGESNVLYDEGFIMKQQYIDNLNKIFTILESMIIKYQPKKKIKYGEMFDWFYAVWKFTENGLAGQRYKIKDTDAFYSWMRDTENGRIERDRYFTNVHGEQVEAKHSFRSKLSRMSKENFEYRIVEIEKDITRDLPKLIKGGTIMAVGSRSGGLTLDQVAKHNNMVTGAGKSISMLDLHSQRGEKLEINEIKPVFKGGKRVLENTNIETSADNKKLYHQVQK